MKKVQVLLSTMNRKDHDILDKMNINSEIIVINQNQLTNYESFIHKNHNVFWYSYPDKGIGVSRNTALEKANAEIILFADDDVTYNDDYVEIINSEFEKNKDADGIMLNYINTSDTRFSYFIKRRHRVHFYNCLRYGTYQFAFRLDRIREKDLSFSEQFGGGCRYGSGEDSLFIMNCIKNGLHIYASPQIIGTVSHEDSTWFEGYIEKYFYDKGALFCEISRRFTKILCLQFCIRHPEMMTNLSRIEAYRQMLKGASDYKNYDRL